MKPFDAKNVLKRYAGGIAITSVRHALIIANANDGHLAA
jgi:hypothetical protein